MAVVSNTVYKPIDHSPYSDLSPYDFHYLYLLKKKKNIGWDLTESQHCNNEGRSVLSKGNYVEKSTCYINTPQKFVSLWTFQPTLV